MIIAVDFDGTIVQPLFPKIGKPVAGAFEWMKRFQKAKAKLILWTMRSNQQRSGDVLDEAVAFCRSKGLEFWGINSNPEQDWSSSNKAYANAYIDDNAVGCPMKLDNDGYMVVDWEQVGPLVMEKIRQYFHEE
jgi:hypothetical protein